MVRKKLAFSECRTRPAINMSCCLGYTTYHGGRTMIDVKRAMTGTTLTLKDSQDNSGTEKSFDFVEQLLTKDLDYKDDEETRKDGEEGIDTGPLEMETDALELDEMPDMHEDLPHDHNTSDLDVSMLSLPTITAESETPARKPPVRRRRSEEDENMVNAADAG